MLFQWHPTLNQIKDLIEGSTGLRFNSMLGNLYRDGHDSVAWHSDDEKSLGPDPTIASVSLGDTRTFQMRKKPPQVRSSFVCKIMCCFLAVLILSQFNSSCAQILGRHFKALYKHALFFKIIKHFFL